MQQYEQILEMEANEMPLNLTAVAADTTGVVKMEADGTSANVASANTSSSNDATTIAAAEKLTE
ncbi:hypothetical protein TSAR_015599 [Trichomalopsis sarcophagae]|uniref:Uncharacterized protein n=1 Tax=Trichomalopsis sarcophagae TaxID=543379 RepID=A0A232ELS5_9HYME|nr:hypothetical protein TSAR_015599 [Trichomalopsis sarcophagae]